MDEREERFRGLFDAGYQPLQAYARRRLPAVDADDLVADVFTVAWRRLDDIPADRALPWLYGVARRILANHRRGDERRRRLHDRIRLHAAVDVADRAEPPTTDDTVLAALAALRVGDREILRLAAWEQLGPAELAVVYGCSTNAAALRLSRARGRLRHAMTEIAPGRTPFERTTTDD